MHARRFCPSRGSLSAPGLGQVRPGDQRVRVGDEDICKCPTTRTPALSCRNSGRATFSEPDAVSTRHPVSTRYALTRIHLSGGIGQLRLTVTGAGTGPTGLVPSPPS